MDGTATPLPEDYAQVLDDLRRQVRTARAEALRAANAEMLALYRTIGRTMLDRQRQGWEEAAVARLAAELRVAFPDIRGLSPRNLQHMRAFAEAWPDPAAAPAVQRLPWGHIRTLLDEIGSPDIRDWYAAAAADHGWSHDVLLNQIMNRSHLRMPRQPSSTARPEPEA